MSEGIRAVTYRHYVVCSICGKRAESRLADERGGGFKLEREHANQRRAEGWRVFVGRNRRWYCPEHGPGQGHTMFEDTGR